MAIEPSVGARTPLSVRTLPTQARSRQTFERILEDTGVLLEEVGFDAFNTNLLAERSGVAVRAIYRYFPNKFALVLELARRMEQSWHNAMAVVSREAQDTTWPDIWPKYLDRYVATVHATRGGVAVLRAMRSYPELKSVDDEMNARYVQEIYNALRRAAPDADRLVSRQIASLLLNTTVAVIDATLDASQRVARLQLELLKQMHVDLLQRHMVADRL